MKELLLVLHFAFYLFLYLLDVYKRQPKSVLGKRLAVAMKGTFESKYDKHQPNRGFEGTVSSRNLYVLLKAASPHYY